MRGGTNQYLRSRFAHGSNYKQALADYVQVGGRIAMTPRYASGVWWTRWFNLDNLDVMQLVNDYKSRSIPLDVFVLDMDWHTKNDWTGYSWDLRLFPDPADTLAALHVCYVVFINSLALTYLRRMLACTLRPICTTQTALANGRQCMIRWPRPLVAIPN